jgi:hypothetical protein
MFGHVYRKAWRARAVDRRMRALKSLSDDDLIALLQPPRRPRTSVRTDPEPVIAKAEPLQTIHVNVVPARHKTIKMHRDVNGDLTATVTES